MSQNKKYAGNSTDKNKNSNSNSATPYKRKYGFEKFLEEVDPFFYEPGELKKAQAVHEQLTQLFQGASVMHDANKKDFVVGTVVATTKEGHYVNIGRKYDGFAPLAEGDGLTVDQEAEFYVIAAPGKNGVATISANMARGWRKLEAAQGSSELFTVRVFSEAITKRTQKSAGLRVEFEEGDFKGIRGFIPNTEVSRSSRAKDLVGTEILVTVIKAESQHGSEYGNLVASHKFAQNMADEITFNNMVPKTIVTGKILDMIKASPNDSKMSALIKLDNGLVGMLHRSETVQAQDSLSDMYKVGDAITVAVRTVDQDRRRIGLSLKLAAQMNCIAQITPGTVVEARILRKVVYGYFASIGGAMEGLIHESDLNYANGRSESFQTGDTVNVVVLSFNEDGTRLALGRKQLTSQK